jgi:hypothetical protein
MKRNRMIILCVTAVVATVLLVPATSRAASASTVADSYTNASYPNTNYGTKAYVKVDHSPVLKAYLKFDVSGTGGQPVVSGSTPSQELAGRRRRARADTSWVSGDHRDQRSVAGPCRSSGPFAAGKWISLT